MMNKISPKLVITLILWWCIMGFAAGWGMGYYSQPKPIITTINPQLATQTKPCIENKISRAPDISLNLVNVYKYVHDNSILDKVTAKKIVDLTFEYADRPLLLLALFNKESNFNPFATGTIGEAGLGQIRPKMHYKDLQEGINLPLKRSLYNIEWNIKATSWLINKWMKETDGDIFALFDKYNGGKNGLKYTKPLLKYYFKIKEAYDEPYRTAKMEKIKVELLNHQRDVHLATPLSEGILTDPLL